MLEVTTAVGTRPIDSMRERNVVADFFLPFCYQPSRDAVTGTETRIADGTPHTYGDASTGADVPDFALVMAAKNTKKLRF